MKESTSKLDVDLTTHPRLHVALPVASATATVSRPPDGYDVVATTSASASGSSTEPIQLDSDPQFDSQTALTTLLTMQDAPTMLFTTQATPSMPFTT